MRIFAPETTIGVRIVWTVVSAAMIALAICGTIVAVLQTNAVDSRTTSDLQVIEDELRVLATSGTDPTTGQPFADPSAVIRTRLEHSVLREGESTVGFSDTRLRWLAPVSVSLRPEKDAELMAAITPHVQGSETIIDTFRTANGTFKVLIAPIHAGTVSAALVYVIDMDEAMAGLRSTLWTYGVVGVFTIVLIAGLAHLVVSRLLRPIEDLRIAAESIDESDLTSRVPVRSRDDLGRLAVAFNHMLDRVENASTAQRELLDDVGHELRTPVTILRGHLELLDPHEPDDIEQTRDLLLDESQRMGHLVEDILILAKASQTDFVTRCPVKIEDLTASVFDKATALGDRRWTLAECAEGEAFLDAGRITQAWLQLADNAVKYSNAGSAIEIGSTITGRELHLWVRDQGIGIEAEHVEKIRHRFWRAAAAITKAPGSGLGLSIVDSILRAHDGHLDIRSWVGVGSTFTMTVPLAAFLRQEKTPNEPNSYR